MEKPPSPTIPLVALEDPQVLEDLNIDELLLPVERSVEKDLPPTCLLLLAASFTMPSALLFLGSKIVKDPTTLLNAVLT